MAIAAATRGTPLATATDANSYTMTDGGTPSNGILLLALINISGTVIVNTFDGYGQTWTLIGRSPDTELELYACITASATSTAPVATDTGAPTGMNLMVIEVTGAYVAGTVLDAFEQQTAGVYVAGADDVTGTATSLSVTLKSPDNAANRAFSSFQRNVGGGGFTPRASWTEIADIGHSTPARSLEAQYRSDAHETTASATFTAANVEGLAWTIRDASAPPGGATTVSVSTQGQVTFTGQAVATRQTQDVTAGAIGLAGQALGLRLGLNVTNGAVTFTGATVGLRTAIPVSGAGAVTFAGQTVTAGAGITTLITPTAGAVTFAGRTVTPVFRTVVTPDAGTLELSGQELAVFSPTILSTTAGQVTWTGQTVSVQQVVVVTAAGQLEVAGLEVAIALISWSVPPLQKQALWRVRLDANANHRPVLARRATWTERDAALASVP